MLKWAAVAIAISSAAGAQSAPIYLECALSGSKAPLNIVLTLNDADQSAIMTLSTGRVVTRKAMFSPSQVRVLDDESTWIISRTDLSLHRQVVIGEQSWDDVGACKLQPTPAKRAF